MHIRHESFRRNGGFSIPVSYSRRFLRYNVKQKIIPIINANTRKLLILTIQKPMSLVLPRKWYAIRSNMSRNIAQSSSERSMYLRAGMRVFVINTKSASIPQIRVRANIIFNWYSFNRSIIVSIFPRRPPFYIMTKQTVYIYVNTPKSFDDP